MLPCSDISSGPGLRPWATKAPNKIAVTLSPGMPNVNKGTRVGPLTALFAASGAAMPSNSPFPNFSGFCELFLAAAYPTNAATTWPTPGIIPIVVPITVLLKIVFLNFKNSFHVNFSSFFRFSFVLIKSLVFVSIFIKISGIANNPINIGKSGTPALNSKTSKVNRDNAAIGSCPIIAIKRPVASIIMFFPTLPLDVEEIINILRNKIAANSGGPINKAIRAIGPINKIVTISLEKSAITDEKRAVSRAFLPLPIFVKGGPSNVVATDAPVPGNETSIAGIDPPKIPPL